MEKQFELNYAASPTEAKAQVQAFLNAVGTKLCEIDEHESLIMESVSRLEFISETLPNLKSGAETAHDFSKEWISFLSEKSANAEVLYKDYVSNAEPEDEGIEIHIKLSLDYVNRLISHLKDIETSLIHLTEAADVLLWAVQNADLSHKLKMYMLDETSRFQLKYWPLTINVEQTTNN
ncbi:MAG: hypothetical protein IJQ44_05930 [Bacteroidaceae bacterium]|nr:hypothetical protein [Bacteroidaceae bacterium]